MSEPEKHMKYPDYGATISCSFTGNTYTIREKIGEGSYGIVYACSDIWNNNLAIKLFKPNGPFDYVERNATIERNNLIQLRHPCITYLFDAFLFENTFYIVTERCLNSLSYIIDLPNFNELNWLIPIARQLLQAVHFLHINNFVHQDIHEGNVFASFVNDEMIPTKESVIQFKLGDLGLSKFIGDKSLANTLAPWMIPPEVRNPEEFGPIDYRIDIYHLGLLFLQFAYSKRLRFTEVEIAEGKPRQMALNLSQPYNNAIEKSLRRHVLMRTNSVMELWHDLNKPIGLADSK